MILLLNRVVHSVVYGKPHHCMLIMYLTFSSFMLVADTHKSQLLRETQLLNVPPPICRGEKL